MGPPRIHHRAFTVHSGSFTWRHGVLLIFHELNSLNYKLICSFQRLRASSFNEICQLLLPILGPENLSHLCRQGYRYLRFVRQKAHGGSYAGSGQQNTRNRSEASNCILRQWLAQPTTSLFLSSCVSTSILVPQSHQGFHNLYIILEENFCFLLSWNWILLLEI